MNNVRVQSSRIPMQPDQRTRSVRGIVDILKPRAKRVAFLEWNSPDRGDDGPSENELRHVVRGREG